MAQKETSNRRRQEDSKTNAVSFRLRDVTICMERTSHPEGVRFTIAPRDDVNYYPPDSVVVGQATTEGNGTILYLEWWEDVTVLEMANVTGARGFVKIVIGKHTSK